LEAETMSSSTSLESLVREQYGQAARSGLSSEHAGVQAVARAFGYSPEELASIPAEANLGLSCGNPTAFASLRPGEVVVDLGSGGGLDVFLAAQRVGPTGRAIGIDMTEAMIDLARRNARTADRGQPLPNVEFHLAPIDRMPLPDASVDCIISNCVINLAVDKRAVFREMARVLKPGGRLAISDVALKQALPEELATSLMAYVGCVGGAIPMAEYEQGLSESGFSGVEILDSHADLNAYTQVGGQAGCCSPAMTGVDVVELSEGTPQASLGLEIVVAGGGCCGTGGVAGDGATVDGSAQVPGWQVLKNYDINQYASSVKIFAVRG
jgi:SAM-dependent methyltransferase